jgi:hypothetical protein
MIVWQSMPECLAKRANQFRALPIEEVGTVGGTIHQSSQSVDQSSPYRANPTPSLRENDSIAIHDPIVHECAKLLQSYRVELEYLSAGRNFSCGLNYPYQRINHERASHFEIINPFMR